MLGASACALGLLYRVHYGTVYCTHCHHCALRATCTCVHAENLVHIVRTVQNLHTVMVYSMVHSINTHSCRYPTGLAVVLRVRTMELMLFYFSQRGIDAEEAVSMIINGFCKDVFQQLPMEFAVEATNLLSFKLEGSVG